MKGRPTYTRSLECQFGKFKKLQQFENGGVSKNDRNSKITIL
jgi:hypothetical protein